LKWWCNAKIRNDGKVGMLNIDRDKYLKEFMVLNPPDFRISQKCCTYAKKEVAQKFIKKENADLSMIGIRKSEGGIRSAQYKTCFTPGDTCDNYRPIFWITDTVKALYNEKYKVENSRCYTEYGLTRTGCVGCPFNNKFDEELELIKDKEPLLYKAVNKVFGKSYDYTRRYREYKKKREEMEVINECD
jgi:3'-phosphoadenosine 5'-phosphosulfate sulfotransferase (PAPS reductase)/FAD synthetase